MEESAYIGSVVAGLVYFALGARLVWLGIRTGSTPERLLGLSFLMWGLSYLFWIIPIALPSQSAAESQLLLGGRILNNLGNVVIACFTLVAFRSRSTWAKWLVAMIATFMTIGTVGSIWVGDPEGVDPLTNAWWWLEWIGVIAPSIWIGVEGLHHYGITRPRVRLGLCTPIANHRFLLLGLAGVFWTLLEFVIVGQFVEFWASGFWSSQLDLMVGFGDIVALAMIWLAYLPPATYQRWVARSPSVANA